VHEVLPIATDVARSVVSLSVCLAHGWAVHKRLNWSRYRLGIVQGPRYHVLDGIKIATWVGTLDWRHVRAHCSVGPTFAWVECARRRRLCPSSASSERMHSQPREVTWQDGDAAACQINLDTCYHISVHLASRLDWRFCWECRGTATHLKVSPSSDTYQVKIRENTVIKAIHANDCINSTVMHGERVRLRWWPLTSP